MIAFDSEPIKGQRMLMLEADQGASPLDDCGWYQIKGQILMLEADQGPPLSVNCIQ